MNVVLGDVAVTVAFAASVGAAGLILAGILRRDLALLVARDAAAGVASRPRPGSRRCATSSTP